MFGNVSKKSLGVRRFSTNPYHWNSMRLKIPSHSLVFPRRSPERKTLKTRTFLDLYFLRFSKNSWCVVRFFKKSYLWNSMCLKNPFHSLVFLRRTSERKPLEKSHVARTLFSAIFQKNPYVQCIFFNRSLSLKQNAFEKSAMFQSDFSAFFNAIWIFGD